MSDGKSAKPILCNGKGCAYFIGKSEKPNLEKCVFRVGCFPDTVAEERDVKYIFVSLDMDLYKPIYEGIIFFIHDLRIEQN